MKKVLFLAVPILCLVALAGCVQVHVSRYSDSTTDFTASVTNTQSGEIQGTFPVLELANRLGNVRVIGIESGPITWTWKLTASAETEAFARDVAKRASCVAQPDREKLRIAITLPDMEGKARFQSDLEIRVPKSVMVSARNTYGFLEISDLTGDVEANNRSGAIEIRNVNGKVRAQNSYAPLKLKNIGAAILRNQSGVIEVSAVHGSLDAETSYESLTAEDVSGGARLRNQSGRIGLTRCGGYVDASTSYASLDISEVKGDAILGNQSGAISAENVTGLIKAGTSYASLTIKSGSPGFICQNQSGLIRMEATSLSVTNIEARTTYASLELRLPKDLKPALQAQTTYADIETDYPVLMKEAASELPPGTPRVNLRNQSGKISVTRQQ